MKSEKIEKNEFIVSRNLLIFLNFIFFVLLCVLRMDIATQLPVAIYLLLVGSGYFIMPIVILIGWWICLIHYLTDKFERLGGRDSLKNRIIILGYVVLVFGCTIPLWEGINDLIGFVSRYKDYIDKLLDCVLIKMALIGGWSFCILKSIKVLKISGTEERFFYKRIILCMLLAIMLFYIRVSTSEYIAVKADDMWYEWLHEQGEEK